MSMSGPLRVSRFDGYNPGFDLLLTGAWDLSFADDLEFGLWAELNFASVLLRPLDTVEVKRDSRAPETGNVFVETRQMGPGGSEWRPSGISSTTASLWAFVLPNGVTIVAPPEVIRAAIDGLPEVEQGRDPSNRAMGVPLKISRLIGARA
jgi:hypothetical protein